MKSLFHFLRLVRFGNLVVIALTMGIIQVFIAAHGNSAVSPALEYLLKAEMSQLEFLFFKYNINLDFLLLILSVVFIAAAGNVINDYFDVKADRVNKPERLIIGKHIKRRWAIVFNWLLNFGGLAIAIYLSIIYNNWWISIIAFIIINFLWFYSAIYKRRLFVGNVLVAFMVGVVPIYVLIFNLPLDGYAVANKLTGHLGDWFVIEVVGIISVIAFVINLMREVIKDIADIRGDLHIAARTIPIAMGIKKTKIVLLILAIPLLLLMVFYLFNIYNYEWMNNWQEQLFNPVSLKFFTLLVVMSIMFMIAAFLLLLTANRRKIYLISSTLLKYSMIFGTVSPLLLL